MHSLYVLKMKKLLTITVVSFAALAGFLILYFADSKKDTIIHSHCQLTVTMPSGKVVQANQWFQRDPDTKLALKPIEKGNKSYYLNEHLNLENIAMVDSDGANLPLIITSMTSKSSVDGHVYEYVASSEVNKPEPVGTGQPM